MEELKQHRVLLSFIAILVFIKFVVIPVLDWQETVIIDIQNKERKLEKASQLIKRSGSFQEDRKLISAQLKEAEQLFFSLQVDSDFKLTQQKYLEQLMATHNLNVENFGWQTSSVNDSMLLKKYQVQVRFSGNITDLVNFIISLDQHSKRYEVTNFNFSFPPGSSNIRNGRLSINFYMDQSDKEVKIGELAKSRIRSTQAVMLGIG